MCIQYSQWIGPADIQNAIFDYNYGSVAVIYGMYMELFVVRCGASAATTMPGAVVPKIMLIKWWAVPDDLPAQFIQRIDFNFGTLLPKLDDALYNTMRVLLATRSISKSTRWRRPLHRKWPDKKKHETNPNYQNRCSSGQHHHCVINYGKLATVGAMVVAKSSKWMNKWRAKKAMLRSSHHTTVYQRTGRRQQAVAPYDHPSKRKFTTTNNNNKNAVPIAERNGIAQSS